MSEIHTMPHGETQSEKDWWQAFIHESGHAIMGTLQHVRCFGVFIQKEKVKVCVLTASLPKPSTLTDQMRLYLAAGSAAERVILGNENIEASRGDREIFGNPVDTTFEEKVAEGEILLLKEKPTLERLAWHLFDLVKRADGNFHGFRSQQSGPKGGPYEDYWVLLNDEELKAELKNVVQLKLPT